MGDRSAARVPSTPTGKTTSKPPLAPMQADAQKSKGKGGKLKIGLALGREPWVHAQDLLSAGNTEHRRHIRFYAALAQHPSETVQDYSLDEIAKEIGVSAKNLMYFINEDRTRNVSVADAKREALAELVSGDRQHAPWLLDGIWFRNEDCLAPAWLQRMEIPALVGRIAFWTAMGHLRLMSCELGGKVVLKTKDSTKATIISHLVPGSPWFGSRRRGLQSTDLTADQLRSLCPELASLSEASWQTLRTGLGSIAAFEIPMEAVWSFAADQVRHAASLVPLLTKPHDIRAMEQIGPAFVQMVPDGLRVAPLPARPITPPSSAPPPTPAPSPPSRSRR